ncbi:uncharacterized protein BDZ99DRAFT_540415, partial [Mytilinidion resinicola]
YLKPNIFQRFEALKSRALWTSSNSRAIKHGSTIYTTYTTKHHQSIARHKTDTSDTSANPLTPTSPVPHPQPQSHHHSTMPTPTPVTPAHTSFRPHSLLSPNNPTELASPIPSPSPQSLPRSIRYNALYCPLLFLLYEHLVTTPLSGSYTLAWPSHLASLAVFCFIALPVALFPPRRLATHWQRATLGVYWATLRVV